MDNETLSTIEDEITENPHTIGVVVGYAAATALVVVAGLRVKSWLEERKAKKAEKTTDENE
jgi:hypothetical protein